MFFKATAEILFYNTFNVKKEKIPLDKDNPKLRDYRFRLD